MDRSLSFFFYFSRENIRNFPITFFFLLKHANLLKLKKLNELKYKEIINSYKKIHSIIRTHTHTK